MVTERTRTEVWQGLWDARRMVRYYQAVCTQYQRLHRITLWVLVLFGASAVVPVWDRIPDVVQPVAGLLVAAMSLWILFADYAAKSAVSLSIATQCEELASEWATLFAQLDNPDEEVEEQQARQSLDDLKRRMRDATYRSGDAKLVDNERINKKATAAATEELKASFA